MALKIIFMFPSRLHVYSLLPDHVGHDNEKINKRYHLSPFCIRRRHRYYPFDRSKFIIRFLFFSSLLCHVGRAQVRR